MRTLGRRRSLALFAVGTLLAWSMPTDLVWAQPVGLPAPRLLTTMPMGAQVGGEIDVTIAGDDLQQADELVFSDPRLVATHKRDAAGKILPNQYTVKIAADCPLGLHEARVMTRLGLSSSRAFSVGALSEVARTKANTSAETAMELKVNSICNASTSPRNIDYYSFEGRKGQRIVVDCGAKGIDSKLSAVLIVADATGNDLAVERRGGALDFTLPQDGKYLIKVHELTYQGGPAYFYRLALQELAPGAPIVRLPATRTVNSFSWPPTGLAEQAAAQEVEPNNVTQAQKITLPCDISGSFFPAADVDVFEFDAKKGDVWWVEVASERFGLPTDPAALVQHVGTADGAEKLTDVAELSDIPSPVKISSNGYAYDGPPYNAGSADVLGKVVIQQDGRHRLSLSDLFGGTRNDPRNVYRLVIRKAAPDFALVAWPLHMELRNGDRNALSKPIALRGGATMALEVVVVRRDGFDGEIELAMDRLPSGVRATGLKIPAGKSRGIMLVTADEHASHGYASANFLGRAKIDGVEVARPCRLATMAWPVPDAWGELPYPRLMADVPVSTSGEELAPVTLAAAKREAFEAPAGTKLTIPLTEVRRGELNANAISMRVFGAGFEQSAAVSVSLAADKTEVVFDLAALKTPPGDYLIALYGGTVAKYRPWSEAAVKAEAQQRDAQAQVAALDSEAKKLDAAAKAAPPEKKVQADEACKQMATKQKTAMAALNTAAEQAKKAAAASEPKGIADIVVSEPIMIRVLSAEKK
ncbi:MAG: PPC domain-containing protein [Planctomycetes bacterium]|nr:PPC domain-containing protein [Planctomycetota bacterium]